MIGIRNRYAAVGLLAVGMLTSVGCSQGPAFAEVEGKVTRNGKPLSNVRVEFWPELTGPKSTAVTDARGHFVLKSDDGKRDGAIVGSHKVLVRDLDVYGDKFLGRKAENMSSLSGGKKSRLGAQYADATKTPLKKDVAPGDKNVIDIEVK